MKYTQRITIYQDSKYPVLVETIKAVLESVVSKAMITDRSGHKSVYAYSKHLDQIFPHGKGPKHSRNIVFNDLQKAAIAAYPRQILRGLFHSDGCIFQNTIRTNTKVYAYTTFTFTNKSACICNLFESLCNRLNITFSKCVKNSTTYTIARRKDVAVLEEFVEHKR